MTKAYNINFTTNKIIIADNKEKAKEIFNNLYARELSYNPDATYSIEKIHPLSKEYLSQFETYLHYDYLLELLDAINIKIQTESYIIRILSDIEDNIGIYNEKYFDTYLCDKIQDDSNLVEPETVTKQFKDYKNGEYDKYTKFYKTKDGKYMMTIL